MVPPGLSAEGLICHCDKCEMKMPKRKGAHAATEKRQGLLHAPQLLVQTCSGTKEESREAENSVHVE